MAARRISFESQLGSFDLTFPEGHTFAEDEETIVATYGRDTVTIRKADVANLKVEATYTRKGYE